ncbi:type II secretion system protein N [Psychromonas sp. 14N.309.X.WAT.B.A12]|uniref:type II secretion system protein N n=1 Tax=unclassified Psychromonas TaxID=2614957 RepID=UPI0025B187C6|nr:type II secretion system protein N [Psychromonas sp. 14N.309.X.WAT.B.A12]MDN2664450.1 type II secretion system protein N [Psychromonas sp. 14N.309.X.WAT.B.A12]
MKVKIAILVVLVYLMTLIVKLPAAVVVDWLPLNGIKIQNASGTIWQGQAKQIEVNRKLSFENVKWDVSLMDLFTLNLAGDVSFYNGSDAMSGKGFVSYGSAGIKATNVILDLSSRELLTFIPMRLPVKIEGQFSAVIKEFVQGQPYCQQLQGNVLWQNAVVNSQLGRVNLDSPTVELGCDDGDITAFVSQKSDELTTALDITLSEGGVYKLNGEIEGTDKLAPSVAKSLNWIGPKNTSGATTVTFSGQL